MAACLLANSDVIVCARAGDGVRKICLSTATGAEAFCLKHGFQPGQGYFHLYQW